MPRCGLVFHRRGPLLWSSCEGLRARVVEQVEKSTVGHSLARPQCAAPWSGAGGRRVLCGEEYGVASTPRQRHCVDRRGRLIVAFKNKEDFNDWRRKQRAHRRKYALCVECGGAAMGGMRKCEACNSKKNESERKNKPTRLEKRRALGICPDCSQQAEIGKVRCSNCLDKLSGRYHKRKYEWCAGCHTSTPNRPVPGKTMCQSCLDKANERNRRLRNIVLEHYGCFCHCVSCDCKVKNPRHLTIDHKNNNGAKHRRETRGIGSIYRWLIKNNFPEDFQVLCWNCNLAKEKYGGCCDGSK